MKSIKTKWFVLLQKEEGFKESELNSLIFQNVNIEKSLMIYRNKLLKQKQILNFVDDYSIENIQDWFLEPISQSQFDYIKECMKHNNWTIQELWTACREQQVSITTLVKCRNERA